MNNYYQQNPMAYQTRPQLKGRPVASIEEAQACSIDFDGSVFYFPDLANKRIYTKQINMDGTANFQMYELKAVPAPEVPNFITREEFEKTILELRKALAPTDKKQSDEFKF